MTDDDTLRGKRTPVYAGAVVDLGIEYVTLPNGRSVQLEIVRHPGGAAVVALDERLHVCLLRQYRHAAAGWLWELPAGKVDPPESPRQTAERELQEEAGLLATDWTHLGHFFSTPGFCDERIDLYLAKGLTGVTPDVHAHEVIEVHWLGFDEALDRLHSGEITDGKTIIGLLLAGRILRSDADGPSPLTTRLTVQTLC